MISYNHVVVIGNLTRDPDVKTVGNGVKLAHMSLCINEKRKTQDGKFIDSPVFVDVEAWMRLAEMCEKHLAKSSCIFVEGKLQMSQWEKDGIKHQKLKIRASNIKFLTKTKANGYKKKEDRTHSDTRASSSQYQEQDTFVPDEASSFEDEGDEAFSETMRSWN